MLLGVKTLLVKKDAHECAPKNSHVLVYRK